MLRLQVRGHTQQVLLERIAHEPLHSVRRALADAVATAASQSVPQGQWPALLGFLHQCSSADSAEHREVALLLFAALFETVGECRSAVCWRSGVSAAAPLCVLRIPVTDSLNPPPPPSTLHTGEHLAPHVPTILQATAAGSAHPSALVQMAALSAIPPLLEFVSEQHVPAFQQLVGALLACGQAAVAAGNEDLLVRLCQVCLFVGWLVETAAHRAAWAVVSCRTRGSGQHNRPTDATPRRTQVLLEAAERPAPLLGPGLQQVLEMCMVIATNARFEFSTREQALHLLQFMVSGWRLARGARHRGAVRVCCGPSAMPVAAPDVVVNRVVSCRATSSGQVQAEAADAEQAAAQGHPGGCV